MKAMMDVLSEERPCNKPIPPGATGHDHAYANGIEVGYRICVASIRALAMSPQTTDDIVATFEEEEYKNG